ncbi:MAG: dehydratase [marine bacterium B5-7]|nr:MAG: dehydratase [marine bacterium B5-7]
MFYKGKGFIEVEMGETFGATLTVTEGHIVTACGMFGDFNPVHSNHEFAARTLFGRPVLHGPFTSALVTAPVGMFFEGTAIAYLEHNCRFVKPVYAGDTLTTTWTITAKVEKPRHDGGVISMAATCQNQNNEEVANADGAILVMNKLMPEMKSA